MINQLVFVIALLCISFGINNADFWQNYHDMHIAVYLNERETSIGGKLLLTIREEYVNDVLMSKKRIEIDEGYEDPSTFLPSSNFIDVREEIEQSMVFKIIKKMPKGAVLNSHINAFTSNKWVFHNVTYRDNLYILDESLILRFFNETPKDLNWYLLSDMRKNETEAENIDARIREELSIDINNITSDYCTENDSWLRHTRISSFLRPLLSYKSVFEDYFYQGLQELYEDNILYLELRTDFSTLQDLNGHFYGLSDIVKIYSGVVERFIQDHPDFLGVKYIYAPIKSEFKVKEHVETALKLKEQFPTLIAGFDLLSEGDSNVSLKSYMHLLPSVVDKMNVFFHAGEDNWQGLSSDDELIDAVLLNSSRISHGYTLVKHPELLKLVIERDIAIEVCPISNQISGLVNDLRNHPATSLLTNDVPVIISNDRPSFWGATGLSYDFYEAFMGMMSNDIDIRALQQLALNSIKYSSMNDDEQKYAIKIFNKKWWEFIRKMIYESSEIF